MARFSRKVTKPKQQQQKRPEMPIKKQKENLDRFEKRIFGPRGSPGNPKLKDLKPGRKDLREDLRRRFKQFLSG